MPHQDPRRTIVGLHNLPFALDPLPRPDNEATKTMSSIHPMSQGSAGSVFDAKKYGILEHGTINFEATNRKAHFMRVRGHDLQGDAERCWKKFLQAAAGAARPRCK